MLGQATMQMPVLNRVCFGPVPICSVFFFLCWALGDSNKTHEPPGWLQGVFLDVWPLVCLAPLGVPSTYTSTHISHQPVVRGTQEPGPSKPLCVSYCRKAMPGPRNPSWSLAALDEPTSPHPLAVGCYGNFPVSSLSLW